MTRNKKNIDVELIRSLIPTGKENAIHVDDLANKLNVSSGSIKEYIKKARHTGENNICSGRVGYWLAESEEEKHVCASMLYKQAITRLMSAKGMNSNNNTIQGQMSLFDSCNSNTKEVCVNGQKES